MGRRTSQSEEEPSACKGKGCPVAVVVKCTKGLPLPTAADGVKMICTNKECSFKDQFLHPECFSALEDYLVDRVATVATTRTWTDSQRRANLWDKRLYPLIKKLVRCPCDKGLLELDHDAMYMKQTAQKKECAGKAATAAAVKKKNRSLEGEKSKSLSSNSGKLNEGGATPTCKQNIQLRQNKQNICSKEDEEEWRHPLGAEATHTGLPIQLFLKTAKSEGEPSIASSPPRFWETRSRHQSGNSSQTNGSSGGLVEEFPSLASSSPPVPTPGSEKPTRSYAAIAEDWAIENMIENVLKQCATSQKIEQEKHVKPPMKSKLNENAKPFVPSRIRAAVAMTPPPDFEKNFVPSMATQEFSSHFSLPTPPIMTQSFLSTPPLSPNGQEQPLGVRPAPSSVVGFAPKTSEDDWLATEGKKRVKKMKKEEAEGGEARHRERQSVAEMEEIRNLKTGIAHRFVRWKTARHHFILRLHEAADMVSPKRICDGLVLQVDSLHKTIAGWMLLFCVLSIAANVFSANSLLLQRFELFNWGMVVSLSVTVLNVGFWLAEYAKVLAVGWDVAEALHFENYLFSRLDDVFSRLFHTSCEQLSKRRTPSEVPSSTLFLFTVSSALVKAVVVVALLTPALGPSSLFIRDAPLVSALAAILLALASLFDLALVTRVIDDLKETRGTEVAERLREHAEELQEHVDCMVADLEGRGLETKGNAANTSER